LKRTKDDLITYRIQRARESLAEAKILANNSHWNTVANRLYYSCFYIVNALFAKHNILATTHSGIKSEFHKFFIKKGIFEKSFGKLYSELFDKRQEGDYQDFNFFDKDEIEPLIKHAEEFITILERYIQTR